MDALRPYQLSAVRAVEEAFEQGSRHVLLLMATGTGKTATAVCAVDRLMRDRSVGRVLFLADRRVGRDQARGAATAPGALGSRYPVLDLDDMSPRALPEAFVCFATVQAAMRNAKVFRHGMIDLIVYDGHTDVRAGLSPIVERTNAATLSLGPALGGESSTAFRYTVEEAVRDGYLITSQAARLRRLPDQGDVHPATGGEVVLIGADADAAEVWDLANQLRAAGFTARVVNQSHDSMDLAALRRGDTLVLLLTPVSVEALEGDDIGRALDRRGVELVPTVLKSCVIPRALAHRGVVDLTAGASLAHALAAANRIDLLPLGPSDFTRLVEELLTGIGFTLTRSPADPDPGFDLHGTYQDSYQLADPVDYAIEVKLSRDGRMSPRVLEQLAARATSAVLVVTSGQLTSPTRAALARYEHKIRVLDGLQIRNLLLDRPDLVARYFPSARASS